MASVINFYLDDSGTRTLDRLPTPFEADRPKWFALGGVLVSEQDEAAARAEYDKLVAKWSIDYPLHSVDIRFGANDFSWVRRDSPEYEPFMRDLGACLQRLPVIGLACVIDRPGYDARYRAKYGRQQWRLCRTAFSIVVERATKWARRTGAKLRVLPEYCNPDDNRRLQRYYSELRREGMPFDPGRSGDYRPLGGAEFSESLHEIRFKRKSSPMAQIADVYLWPMVRCQYVGYYRPHADLHEAGRLIECHLEEGDIDSCGTKYSCFELVRRAAL